MNLMASGPEMCGGGEILDSDQVHFFHSLGSLFVNVIHKYCRERAVEEQNGVQSISCVSPEPLVINELLGDRVVVRLAAPNFQRSLCRVRSRWRLENCWHSSPRQPTRNKSYDEWLNKENIDRIQRAAAYSLVISFYFSRVSKYFFFFAFSQKLLRCHNNLYLSSSSVKSTEKKHSAISVPIRNYTMPK